MLSWRRSPAPFDELKILREIHGPLRNRLFRHVGSLVRDTIPILQVLSSPCNDALSFMYTAIQPPPAYFLKLLLNSIYLLF